MAKTILAINTLTELDAIDWHILTSHNVYVEKLPDFGRYFKTNDIEAALLYAEPIITDLISKLRPDLLVVHSKGVALITYLLSKKLWTGPILLLSPIPNRCSHLGFPGKVFESSTEDEWTMLWRSTLHMLKKHDAAIAFCIGDTIDEKVLIKEFVETACDENGWLFQKVNGDHDWLYNPKNWLTLHEIISLII